MGGLDIAGLAGVFIGGALYQIPVVLDGVISTVAALVAERLVPGTRAYMIPSHKSKEPAAARMLEELALAPVLDGIDDAALGGDSNVDALHNTSAGLLVSVGSDEEQQFISLHVVTSSGLMASGSEGAPEAGKVRR